MATVEVTTENFITFIIDDSLVVTLSGGLWLDLTDLGDAAVDSWNGRTGTVVPLAGDYSADLVTYAGLVPGASTVAEGIDGVCTSLDTEAETRATADSALADDIADEATARVAADAALQASITSEAGTRSSADATLQTNINAEAAARAAADALLAPLASPALTGNPTATTQSPGTNSTRIATTAYADAAVAVEATARASAVTSEATTRATADGLRVAGYTSSGATAGLRAWYGQTTTDGSGNWSVDISAAGLSALVNVKATAILNTATVTDQVWAVVKTATATAVTGSTLRGVSLVALGATVRAGPTGTTVYVEAVGT